MVLIIADPYQQPFLERRVNTNIYGNVFIYHDFPTFHELMRGPGRGAKTDTVKRHYCQPG